MVLRLPNSGLVGRGIEEMSTPFLMLDLAALEANIAAMAEHCARAGIALRPHVKTHKCAEIARRQMAAGAKGLCAAKLGEAEAMADAGLGNILITSPVVGRPAISRLVSLAARAEVLTVVDAIGPAEELSAAAAAAGANIRVLIDLDIGLARTGIAPDEALALAGRVARLPALSLCGLQAYAGHLMHVADADERRTRSLQGLAAVAHVKAEFERAGLSAAIVSGGGTGTFDIDPEARVLSELQAGSYAFMDRQYREVRLANARPWPFAQSLFVVARVVSANHPGHVTIDAGFKAFATDGGEPVIVSGASGGGAANQFSGRSAPEGSKYFFFGDEHGGIALPPGNARLSAGDLVTCLVPHCDPTVNLYDAYHVFEDGRLKALWPIEARGCI